MQIRSPRSIVAVSAALALTAAALAPTAAFAKGPGSGNGAADCDGDCTADQAQVQQVQRQLRNGSGGGGQQRARVQDEAEDASGTQVRAGNGNGSGGNGRNADANTGNGRNAGANAGQGRNASGQGQNAKQGAGKGPNEDGERGPGNCDDCDAEMGTLTEDQADKLIYMYNEEKMAHDVYAAFAEMYGVRVFENIRDSEARHMEAVNTVIERYEGIENDAIDLDPGEFSVETVSMLYETLLADGSASLEDAIDVAVLIEETDIDDLMDSMADLETAEGEVTAPDVHEMYSHLHAGSQNHLAAFQGWQS